MARPRRKPDVHIMYERMSSRRLPRWRYNLIDSMLSRRPKQEPVAGRDDEHLVEGYKFFRIWRKFDRHSGSPLEVERLRRERLWDVNFGLYLATETFFRPGRDRSRDMLEAYILARQSDEWIADQLTMQPEEVQWYERLFFNVRDRLDKHRYVMDVVLNNMGNVGIENFDGPTVVKWFAYWAGTDIADIVADGYDKRTPAPGPDQDRIQFFFQHFAGQCAARASSGVHSVELGQWSFKDFSEYSLRIQELVQKKATEEGGLRSPLEDIAFIMSQSMPWGLGSTRRDVAQQSPVQAYFGHAAEPRVDELLRAAAGNAVVEPEQLAEQQLPKPRKQD